MLPIVEKVGRVGVLAAITLGTPAEIHSVHADRMRIFGPEGYTVSVEQTPGEVCAFVAFDATEFAPDGGGIACASLDQEDPMLMGASYYEQTLFGIKKTAVIYVAVDPQARISTMEIEVGNETIVTPAQDNGLWAQAKAPYIAEQVTLNDSSGNDLLVTYPQATKEATEEAAEKALEDVKN